MFSDPPTSVWCVVCVSTQYVMFRVLASAISVVVKWLYVACVQAVLFGDFSLQETSDLYTGATSDLKVCLYTITILLL